SLMPEAVPQSVQPSPAAAGEGRVRVLRSPATACLEALLAALAATLLAGCGAGQQVIRPSGSASPLAGTVSPVGSWAAGTDVAFVPDQAGANDFGLNALALSALAADKPALLQPDGIAGSSAKLVVGRGGSLLDAFVEAARRQPQ